MPHTAEPLPLRWGVILLGALLVALLTGTLTFATAAGWPATILAGLAAGGVALATLHQILGHPAAWVRTVASRAWWDADDRERKATGAEDRAGREKSAPATDAEEIENRHAFLGYVRALPPSQREVMAWTYDGYRPTEIAARLGKGPAAVRSLLRDARKALIARYGPCKEGR